MKGIIIALAISVAIASTLANPLTHPSRGKSGQGHTDGSCGSGDRRANKLLSDSHDYFDQFSDKTLNEVLLERARRKGNSESLNVQLQSESSKEEREEESSKSDQKSSEKIVHAKTHDAISLVEPAPQEEDEGTTRRLEDSVSEIGESPRIHSRSQRVDKDADTNTKTKIDGVDSTNSDRETTVGNIISHSDDDHEGSNDIDVRSTENDQSDPLPRMLPGRKSAQEQNQVKTAKVSGGRKGELRYRELPVMPEDKSRNKYDPPPYNQRTRKSNSNHHQHGSSNVNVNVNKFTTDNEGRLTDRGDGNNLDHEDSKGSVAAINDKNSSLKPVDLIQLDDAREANVSSTSERVEIISTSTTPAAPIGIVSGSAASGVKKPRNHHKGKGRGKGHGKKNKKKFHHKQRQSTENQQSGRVKPLKVPSMESLPVVSTASAIGNTHESSESAQSSKTKINVSNGGSSVEEDKLTHAILKLLMYNTGESSVTVKRLQRLLSQMNLDEKETILHELEADSDEDPMTLEVGGKTRVKEIIITEARPKLIVGILGRSAQNSLLTTDADAENIESLNDTQDYQETSQSLSEGDTESVSDEENHGKSQDSEDDIDEKMSAQRRQSGVPVPSRDLQAPKQGSSVQSNYKKQTGHNDSRSSHRRHEDVSSAENDYEDDVASQLLGKLKYRALGRTRSNPKLRNSNVNSNTNTNVNENQQEESSFRRSFASKFSREDSDTSSIGDDDEEVTRDHGIGSNLQSGEEDSEEHTNANSNTNSNVNSNVNSNYNGNQNRRSAGKQDNPGPGNVAAKQSQQPRHRRVHQATALKRITPKNLEHELRANNRNTNKNSNVNRNVNKNVNSNNVGDHPENLAGTEVENDIEYTRRAINRFLKHNNRNRNVNSNSNVNVNNIETPVLDDYNEDLESRSSRRSLGHLHANNGNSNSNSNVNTNVNRNTVDHPAHRNVLRRDPHDDEVTLSQKAMDRILREVRDLRLASRRK